MDIPIIYEDENMVAINKPAGLKVHGDQTTNEPTITDWILRRYEESSGVGETLNLSSGKTILRPGIVHRLDKDTSGVLVIAKNEKAFLWLKEQFYDRKVEKTYRVIVYGVTKNNFGIITAPIGRSTKDFRKRAVKKEMVGDAREAVTEYKILKKKDKFSYIEAYPKTGRTHQIRVHLKSIGHPIVCDKLYASGRECPKVLGRQALHAFRLKIPLPKGGHLLLEAPEPDDFKALLAEAKLV